MAGKNPKRINRSDQNLAKRLGLKNPIFLRMDGDVTKKLMRLIWEKIERARRKNPKQSFCLIITTTGGDWDPARNFFTLVRLRDVNLVTVAVGEVCSSGITILLAGKKRFAQADTEFMDHDITHEKTKESMRDVRNHLMSLCLTNRVHRGIIVKNTKLTARQVGKMYAGGAEIYFDANEAVRMGFVHTVLE